MDRYININREELLLKRMWIHPRVAERLTFLSDRTTLSNYLVSQGQIDWAVKVIMAKYRMELKIIFRKYERVKQGGTRENSS